jgi:hypothetical protein
VEQIGGFVPMNPHATKVISKKIIKGIARQETQAVGDPVSLIGVVVVVGLGLLA